MKNYPKYLTTRQAAKRLGISCSWLEKLRMTGEGPFYSKPSERRILYRQDDLDVWLAQTRVTSTSQLSHADHLHDNIVASSNANQKEV